jgi:16S rRNA (adenine1518-N6/adenine1519-N6)-dimethyltransferase
MDENPQESLEPASKAHGKKHLQRLFQSRKRRPSRSLGQNFLLDPNLIDFIVRSAEIGPEDAVLEIGAGTGQMTSRMAALASQVVAVEVDRMLFETASAALAGFPNVRLIHADALAGKSRIDPGVVEAAREAAAGGGSLLHVSNLAYRIATPVVLSLLESGLPIRRMVVTVPLELAQKLSARAPGEPGYGSVSVLTAFHGAACILREVPPEVFWPRPQIVSGIVRLDVLPPENRPPADYARFRGLVRGLFTQRRKTAARSLESLEFCGKGEAGPVLRDLGIDPKARPEELSPDAFARLAAALPQRS